jgi:hypothetical protein
MEGRQRVILLRPEDINRASRVLFRPTAMMGRGIESGRRG